MPNKTEAKSEPRGGSLHGAGMRIPWTASKAEEVISVLWMIAALIAWNGGIKWLAIVLFIKAAMDTACSIGLAISEIRTESEDTHSTEEAGK